MYAILALAKGEAVDGTDIHNAWVAWMSYRNQSHPSMREFSLLSRSVKDEDSIFVEAVRHVAKSLDVS